MDRIYAIGLYETLIVITTAFTIWLLKWFTDPYYQYKSGSAARDFEVWAEGKQILYSKVALPYLVRPEHSNATRVSSDDAIHVDELCDLSLVVPCYNEENRLPSMLQEHIKYIQE